MQRNKEYEGLATQTVVVQLSGINAFVVFVLFVGFC